MLRFLSVHWDPHSDEAFGPVSRSKSRIARFLPGWQQAIDRPGVSVYYSKEDSDLEDVHVLDEHCGLIVGVLFRNTPHPMSEAPHAAWLNRAEAIAARESQGRSLISQFWGSYVAFIIDRQAHSHVLRGPLSTIKCLHAQHDGVSYFFSQPDDFAALRLVPLGINWECIRAQAACADYISRATAIAEVSSVEGGECVSMQRRSASSRTFYWHPCDIARGEPVRTFEAAVTHTRSATMQAIEAWASRCGRVAVRLSGGLDSSILASCIRRTLPRSAVVCLNYFTQDITGDERPFARDVAALADVELLERERQRDVDLNIFGSCARTARPILDFSGYGQYGVEVDLARQNHARAILCGELGDNLYDHNGGYEAGADFVWRHRWRPGLIKVLIEHALRRNISFWDSLRRAVKGGLSESTLDRWNSHNFAERELGISVNDLTVVRQEVLQSVRANASDLVHPWLDQIAGTPPAKFLMIYGMFVWSAYEPPFARRHDPPVIAPLASQPLAEVCLRIPTYFANRGGTGRAVARQAFADLLPSSVLSRTTKGTPEPWTRDVVRRNQSFLRSFLFDGILVKERILDPRKLEAVLSNEFDASRIFIGDLIVQLYIEAWLRQWTPSSAALAA